MKRLAMFLAFFACIGLLSMAQTMQITGTVTGSEDGQPLPGASIMVKGTNIGTTTNFEGKYTLSVPTDAKILVINFVGQNTEEIEIGGRAVINVAMVPNIQALNEVVVVATALGIRRQEREVGYAATTIKSGLVTQAKSTNVQQALNGKVSGLNITTTNSGVFENAKINIRGIRSLTGNNQPMLVLDGAPVSLGYLSSISPEDIQDLTVLKSAASAALYGPDAVNGVILVTTKKGAATDKPVITLTSSFQASRVAYFPKMQKDYGGYGGEGAPYIDEFGNTLYVPYENQLYGPKFDGSIQPIGIVDEQGHQQTGPYDNNHWKDKIKFWNTGMTYQNGFSLSGKDYFFSITNADIKGLMPSDKDNRTTLRFSAGKEYKKFSINYSVNYTRSDWNIVNEANMPHLTKSSYTGSVMSNVFQVGANVPLLSYKDLNSEWGKFDNYFCEYAFNPYWIIATLRQKGTSHDLIGNIDLTYKFADWLKANVKTSSNVTYSSLENTDAPTVVSDYTLNVLHRNGTQYYNRPGSVFDDSYVTTRVNVDAFLSGEVNTGDLNFKYILGNTVRSNYYKDIASGGNNLVVSGLNNISIRSGDAQIETGLDPASNNNYNSTVKSRLVSVYGNFTVGYKKFVFVDLTGRNDWDSRLAITNRSVFYPGASLSVIASEIIPSLKESVISYLKLRSAWNKSGNVNIRAYATQPVYNIPLGPNYSTSNPGFPYGSNAGFTAGNTIPSPDLKPEFVTTIEGGFELRMVKDRINLEATYFNQNCTNQVLQVSQSWATGYSTRLANAASFRNYGVEMDLRLTPLVKIGRGDFDISLNATYNDNKVTQTLNDAMVVLGGNSGFIQNAASNPSVNNVAVVGKPAYQFQMTDYNRDPATGKVIVDANGNPSVATNMIVRGRTLPLLIVGISPSYTIGNFSFAMTWDYKTGHDYYAGVGPDMDFSGISARSAEYGRQRFVFPNSVYPAGTNADGSPKYVANTNRLVADGNYTFWTGKTTNTGIATNYYCSAAAIRLREVNITYNLPNKLIAQTKFIKKASVSAVGKNLLMFLPESNQWGDPEFNYSSTGNTMGVSSAYQTPASRFYGATITLQF